MLTIHCGTFNGKLYSFTFVCVFLLRKLLLHITCTLLVKAIVMMPFYFCNLQKSLSPSSKNNDREIFEKISVLTKTINGLQDELTVLRQKAS